MKITDIFRLKTRKAIISLGIGTVIILPTIRNASAMGYYDLYDAVNYKYIYDNPWTLLMFPVSYRQSSEQIQYYIEHLKKAKPNYLDNIDFSPLS